MGSVAGPDESTLEVVFLVFINSTNPLVVRPKGTVVGDLGRRGCRLSSPGPVGRRSSHRLGPGATEDPKV